MIFISVESPFAGKQTFKFSGEFEKELQLKLEAIQEVTIGKALDELISFINDDVYKKPESENKFYKRTKALLEIFEPSKVYSHGGTYGGVYGGIETNGNIFLSHQHPENWQNQSKEENTPPISATDFVNIINNGVEMTGDGKKHSLFGERPPTYFWDDFVDWMINENGYVKLFVQTANELNFPFQLEEESFTSGFNKNKNKSKRSIEIRNTLK